MVFSVREPGSKTQAHISIIIGCRQKSAKVWYRFPRVYRVKHCLKCCLRSKTQYQIEAFHDLIWKVCLQTVDSGRRAVKTAVPLAVCHFTMGLKNYSLRDDERQAWEILRVSVAKNDEEGIYKAENLQRRYQKGESKFNAKSNEKIRREKKEGYKCRPGSFDH